MKTENKWKFDAELVRYEPEENVAWFNFDLGFGEWQVHEVKVDVWHPRDKTPGAKYTVFTQQKRIGRNHKDRSYHATVWMRDM